VSGEACLDDRGENTCRGAVEYRFPMSGTGRSFPRCDKHFDAALASYERINNDYPDSDVPPAWFDPMAAGERWNEDDPWP